jgi:hypothetical protein
MIKIRLWMWRALLLGLLLTGNPFPVQAQALDNLAACERLGFSTEEDFLAGVDTKDGNPLISDGDLLSPDGQVCARNWELLSPFDTRTDLGLDGLDLIDLEKRLVVFSTEIDHPHGLFTAGDLVATNGVVIPNQALLRRFQVGRNLGLDGLHFVGDPAMIRTFLDAATQFTREQWLNEVLLPEWLERYDIDLWFSTEAQERRAATVPIYDGDVLSARFGVVVLAQDQLMAAGVPAGIPNRGVDFGLDGLAGRRKADRSSIRFSSEILYRKDPGFDDGDLLKTAGGVETVHDTLIAAFKPRAKFLGVDALYIWFEEDPNGGFGDDVTTTDDDLYLPLVQTTQQGGGQ